MRGDLLCLDCGEPQRDREGNVRALPPPDYHGYIPDFCDACDHKQAVQHARDRIREARADLRRLSRSEPVLLDVPANKDTDE